MGRIYAIANHKGGVGRTTVCVNLSASLAKRGKRVLIVDLDPNCNASIGLGFSSIEVGISTYHVLTMAISPTLAVKPTAVEGLYLLPAGIDLAGAEVELVSEKGREGLLRRALKGVREDFDYIFIDCPPTLGLLTLNGLVAADEVLAPVQCEYLSLEGLGRLIKTLNLTASALNQDVDLGGIIINMYDGRATSTKNIESDLRAHFGEAVFKTVIPRSVRIAESPSYGLPVFDLDERSAGAVAFDLLSEEFITKTNA